MKHHHAALRFVALTVAFASLLLTNASASNTPIPGIDVVVRKKPAGNALKARTDRAGKFVFPKLEAGTYVVTITPPAKGDGTQPKAIISTSRSNIKRPSLSMVNGKEVVELIVELGSTAPAPIEVKLSMDGGTISGIVTQLPVSKETVGGEEKKK